MEQMTEALAREELKRAAEGDTPMLSRAETLQLLQAWLDADALRKDAERARWLADRMLAADFDYCGDGTQALVFEMPAGFSASADFAATIDAAMAKEQR